MQQLFIICLCALHIICTIGKVNYLALPQYDKSNFACHFFPVLCNNTLSELGCTKSIVEGCPGYPTTLNDITGFIGTCTCLEPFYFSQPGQRVAQELVINRIAPDVGWMLEPWSTGPPYNLSSSYSFM